MVDWYVVAECEWLGPNFGQSEYIDMNGYTEGTMGSQNIQTHGEAGDPFLSYGIDTETWAFGQAQMEIGLIGSHRIRINSSGVRIWTAGDVWADPLAGGLEAHDLDFHTDVIISGTPADNEVLAWNNATSKWINQTAAEAGLSVAGHSHGQLHDQNHDNTDHTTNYHTEADGTGVVTVHSDMTSAGSGSVITTDERNALHAIYTLESHDNTYHSTNYEVANANIQSHVSSPVTDAHHTQYTDAMAQAVSINNVVEDATPQLGGPLDLNDKATTHELVAAVSLVAGDLCYINGSGKMAKADASAEATCDTLLVMCLDTISADATGTFLIFGKWTTSGLTAGAEYWVSLTAGDITITKPSTTGEIIRHVGTAVSTTVLFFNPSHTYVEYVV